MGITGGRYQLRGLRTVSDLYAQYDKGTGCNHQMSTPAELSVIHEDFDTLDTDGSGFIQGAELSKLLEAQLGHEPTHEQVAETLAQFDLNKDGQISFDEYVCWLYPNAAPSDPDRAAFFAKAETANGHHSTAGDPNSHPFEAMEEFIQASTQALSDNERQIFAITYKNFLKSTSIEAGVHGVIKIGSTKHQGFQKSKYITKFALRTINLLDTKLIPLAPAKSESLVFYLKMKGDYYKILFAVSEPASEERSAYGSACEEAYDSAMVEASELPATNPCRLAVVLNFSDYLAEYAGEPVWQAGDWGKQLPLSNSMRVSVGDEAKKARGIEISNKAYTEAIAGLDTLNNEQYGDATTIMQLMMTHHKCWAALPTEGTNTIYSSYYVDVGDHCGGAGPPYYWSP